MKVTKTRWIMLALFVLIVFGILGFALSSGSSSITDPTGGRLIADVSSDLGEIALTANKGYFGSNFIWIMLVGFLVFFFQAGFAMVETGFTRAKNAAHTMTMNFVVFLVGALGYFLVGFALHMGGSGGVATLGSGTGVLNQMVSIEGLGGILGLKGFGLIGTYDVGVYALFFFQMVFMDTTVTIPTGAMAERVKYSAIIITSLFISMFLYPLFANWVWGGGWLATLGLNFGLGHGVVDFAGSGVVHTMGGMIALSGAIIIGPRIAKFKKDGTARAFPGHDIPMAIIGTIILFFCWFAFNAGSTLNASDLRLAVVATNTMIAGATGGLIAMFFMWLRYGKPDPSMTANGALAGLVAITAPSAFVNAFSALFIGGVAGLIVCFAVPFIEQQFKIDDPVGAISVHGINGIWGMLAVGLFADGVYGDGLNGVAGGVRGLFYGDSSQLIAQLIAIAVLIIWGFGLSFVFFKVLDKVWGLRVRPEDELEGLDVPEMGVLAYPSNMLTRSELDYDSLENAHIKQLDRFDYYGDHSFTPTSGKPITIDEAVPVELISAQHSMISDVKLTKIDIITRQNKFEVLKEALNAIGITGMTVTQVLGCGIQRGKSEFYRGAETELNLLPKVQIEIVVAKVPVRLVIETAKKILYTGSIGDGKIFIYDVENVIKVRTGEEGYDALQDE